MRVIFSFLLGSLILSGSLFGGIVEKEYSFSCPEIKFANNYCTLHLPGTSLTGKRGEPLLPYKSVKILLPPGQQAVRIEIVKTNRVDLDGSYRIFPAQPSRPGNSNKDRKFYKNSSVYQTIRYPVESFEHFSTQFLHGFPFVLSAFTPVEYNPSTGSISYYRNIKLKVITEPITYKAGYVRKIHATSAILKQIRSIADNPETASRFGNFVMNFADEYDVLVITSQAFADSLDDLIQSYMNEALKSRIITTDSIAAAYSGIDLQEKIRNCIIYEYENHNIKHVSLIGDVEIIPYRGFYCSVESDETYVSTDIPADLYYSALDGTWNSNSDEKWGEKGEDDLLPELSVARIPASNFTELANMLRKNYMYQFDPVSGQQRNVLFLGEKLWNDPESYGADYLELLIGFHDDNGYSTNGIPEDFNFTKLYDRDRPWVKQDLINELNNSGYACIHHNGHSNTSYNMRLSVYDLKEGLFSGADGVKNNFTYIYSSGCYSAAFDVDVSIGEKFLAIKDLAFAYIGNSRYGWFNEGQTEGPSLHLEREFVSALYGDSLEFIGSAHTRSKINSAPWVNAPGQWEEGALRWCFYDCNVLGDPAVRLWTDEPLSSTIICQNPSQSDSLFRISVNADLSDMQGISAVLIQNNRVVSKAVTDRYGSALFSISSGSLKTGNAVVAAAGKNIIPAKRTINVISSNLQKSGNPAIIAAFPNPAVQSVSITFYVPNSADAELTVFNILGRQVRGYTYKNMTTGYNSQVWNLKDEAGKKVPSGLYIFRLKAEGKVSAKKVTVF